MSLGTIILPATGFLDHTPPKSYLLPNPYLRQCFWGPNPHPETKHTTTQPQGSPVLCSWETMWDFCMWNWHHTLWLPLGAKHTHWKPLSQKLLSFSCRNMKFYFKVTLMACLPKRKTLNNIDCFPPNFSEPLSPVAALSPVGPRALGSQACIWDRTDSLLSWGGETIGNGVLVVRREDFFPQALDLGVESGCPGFKTQLFSFLAKRNFISPSLHFPTCKMGLMINEIMCVKQWG